MVIIATTTAMSCTIRKPTAMRPYSESSSRLSLSSLTMMMVLEKVSATAMYSASIVDLPSSSTSPKPNRMVKVNCPRPVATATAPMWRIWCRSSLSPTTNSSTATPTCDSRWISALACTSENPAGPTAMPSTM